MKNKLLITYAIAMTVAVIVLSIIMTVSSRQTDNEQKAMVVNSTIEPTAEITIEPESPPTPLVTSIQETATPKPRPTPKPTPYVPTEEELAFKESIIKEGKTYTLELSEWDLIDIFCNKMGFNEYLKRIVEIEEEGIYYFPGPNNVEPYINNYIYGIYKDTGDIVVYGVGCAEPEIIGNIFYNETVGDPFRLPEDDELIEIFIERIMKDYYNSDEMEVVISRTLIGDLVFDVLSKQDGSIIKEYYVDYGLWDVYDCFDSTFHEKLFD